MSYLESTVALPPQTSPVECETGEIASQPLRNLCDMLTYRRVSGSRTEGKFIRRYIQPLGAKPDTFGNYILRVGDSPILFSSHTDSVHKTAGRQRLLYKDGILTVKHSKPVKAPKAKTVTYTYKDTTGKTVTRSYQSFASTNNQCLGADDAVGCWMMCEMVKAGVPGLYVWHRQEESGGVGSSYIADNHRSLLTGIKAAIAFDRRGTTDVITHQAGGRCASNVFAQSLASQLPGAFSPSSHGIFTDTANYTDIIGECTNISVGYEDEHTSRESLDLGHALRVRNAMVEFDAGRLEFQRIPGSGKHDYGDDDCRWGMYGNSGGYRDNVVDIWGEDIDQDPQSASTHRTSYDDMVEMIRLNPHEVADMLEEYGMDANGLREELYTRGASRHRL
jgi:hypothetical protein